MSAPIESKVYAALIGGAVGGVASKGVLWLLGVLVWHASSLSGNAGAAIASVPGPVSDVVSGVIGLGCILAGGYMARHTYRSDVVPAEVGGDAAEPSAVNVEPVAATVVDPTLVASRSLESH